MQFINSIFGYPLGWLMWLCYKIVANYGIALIIFTLLTKLILFPLAVKQQKSSLRMARMQPKLEELQKKYGKNKEKYNEEMLKLYDEEKYNPMSGCLPLLIQFPILFGLIDVIYKPMTHILRIPSDVIKIATDIATNNGSIMSYSPQLLAIQGIRQNPQPYIDAMGADVVLSLIHIFDMIRITQIGKQNIYSSIEKSLFSQTFEQNIIFINGLFKHFRIRFKCNCRTCLLSIPDDSQITFGYSTFKTLEISVFSITDLHFQPF